MAGEVKSPNKCYFDLKKGLTCSIDDSSTINFNGKVNYTRSYNCDLKTGICSTLKASLSADNEGQINCVWTNKNNTFSTLINLKGDYKIGYKWNTDKHNYSLEAGLEDDKKFIKFGMKF